MAKILFIEKKLRTDKLGMLYLSAILKKAGHSVNMIQDDIDSADTYLLQEKVDFVMYSVATGDHLWFIKRNKELKRKYKFVSVMGGPHFTFFPEDVLEDNTVDFVVRGPAETAILDIVEGRIKDKLIFGHIPEDVDKIPAPDRSILYKYSEFGQSRMKRFIAGRDCSNSCKYCFNHLYHGLYSKEKHKFFQITDPRKIIEEIEDVQRKYGLELIYFNDDDLARDHKWLAEFCNLITKRLGLPFCGSVRADSLSLDIIIMMANAGCTFLNIALESANPDTQKLLRRGNITNEQIKFTCETCEKHGIKVRLQNMIGLPVDDPLGDALETLEFNKNLDITDSWVAIFQPFPKTDLWRYCLDKNFLSGKVEPKKFYEDTILNIPDAEKINRLHKWWYWAIKYKIPFELLKVLLKQPLTPEVSKEIQDVRWDEGAKTLYEM